jgi:hypothetical protein
MKRFRRGIVVVATLLAIAIACAAYWQSRWQSVKIPDVTRPADLTLRAQPGDEWLLGSVSGISVWVTGEIDGEAEIFAGSSKAQRISGRVDLRVYRDKFEPACMVHYRPNGVTTGWLVVRYKFD